MESQLASIRPYPSSFPQCAPTSPRGGFPSPPPLRTMIHEAGLLQSLSRPYLDENHRKPRPPQETTWIASSASQSVRFPLPHPSPSFTSLPLSWNDAKRRKLAHESHPQVSSPAHQMFSSSDTLTSSALSLASLSSTFREFAPLHIDTSLYTPFPPPRGTPEGLSPSSSSSSSLSPPTSPASRSDTPLSSSSETPSSSFPSPYPSPPTSPAAIKTGVRRHTSPPTSSLLIPSQSAPPSPAATKTEIWRHTSSSLPSLLSPSPSPPSSPSARKIEIRPKGKQLKSRCTCCHV